MILVTGATGNVGSHLTRELSDKGVLVRGSVRDPGKAAAMLGEGVELVFGDFSDAPSVRRALEGVGHLFLTSADGPRRSSMRPA